MSFSNNTKMGEVFRQRFSFCFVLLTDLWEAFGICLNHEPFTAKLNKYGSSCRALNLIYDYFLNKKLRTRVNKSYCEWPGIMFGKTQSSITGPLLFKIFSADLFVMHGNIEIVSLADDNTPQSSAKEN